MEFLNGSPVVAAMLSMQSKLRSEFDVLVGNEVDGLSVRYPDIFPKEVRLLCNGFLFIIIIYCTHDTDIMSHLFTIYYPALYV